MKTMIAILFAGAVVGAFVAGSIYGYIKVTPNRSPQITLEKILSIKELHLVRHTYTDLFFLHRKNDPTKNIRTIIQVPVEVTAFLNLKEIEFIKEGDSIKQIILPRARLNTPQYLVDQMVVHETRAFQFYAGRDLYAEVNKFLQLAIASRADSVVKSASVNKILTQAEDEGKSYITHLLFELGRADIEVSFSGTPTTLETIRKKHESPRTDYTGL